MTIKIVYRGRNISMAYQGSLQDFAEIARGRQVLAACMEVGQMRAVPYAISISPDGPSGLYKRSWEVRPGTVLIRGMLRVCAKVINTSPHAALIEWGGKPGGGRYRGRYRPPQHILQRVRDNLTGRDGSIDADLMG